MKRIELTEELRAKLHGLGGRVHLCDAEGYLVSVIEPTSVNGAASSLVALDDELRALLGDIALGIEFTDPSGDVVARIEPCKSDAERRAATMQKLEDFKRQNDAEARGFTTAEVIEFLRSL